MFPFFFLVSTCFTFSQWSCSVFFISHFHLNISCFTSFLYFPSFLISPVPLFFRFAVTPFYLRFQCLFVSRFRESSFLLTLWSPVRSLTTPVPLTFPEEYPLQSRSFVNVACWRVSSWVPPPTEASFEICLRFIAPVLRGLMGVSNKKWDSSFMYRFSGGSGSRRVRRWGLFVFSICLSFPVWPVCMCEHLFLLHGRVPSCGSDGLPFERLRVSSNTNISQGFQENFILPTFTAVRNSAGRPVRIITRCWRKFSVLFYLLGKTFEDLSWRQGSMGTEFNVFWSVQKHVLELNCLTLRKSRTGRKCYK